MITNPLYPLFNVDSIEKLYNGIKKVKNSELYSSDIAEKISKKEMVNMINDSGIK
jgi:hypothetical protein